MHQRWNRTWRKKKFQLFPHTAFRTLSCSTFFSSSLKLMWPILYLKARQVKQLFSTIPVALILLLLLSICLLLKKKISRREMLIASETVIHVVQINPFIKTTRRIWIIQRMKRLCLLFVSPCAASSKDLKF